MTWINANLDFGQQLKILRISKDHNLSKMGTSCIINGVKGNDIRVVHDILVKGILNMKPDLQGICVHSLQFNFPKLTWDILCSHGTFPYVPYGNDVPVEEVA